MKTRFIKWYNLLLGALLGALGFSSCNIILSPFMRCEYGQPHADYKLIGKVTDQTGKPVKGIRVIFHPELERTPEEDSWYSDTLYSDASGKFSKDHLKYTWPDITNSYVTFEDIDGEENGGSFKSSELPYAAFEVEQTKKGDGSWYSGSFTITADAKLEKE